jgi:dUTP pyrophosphatase
MADDVRVDEIDIPVELGERGTIPEYATAAASGADLRAAIEEPITLLPGARVAISSGVRLAIPQGYEGQVRSRSGLAAEFGLIVLNAPGTIDSDFRGEVLALLANFGRDTVTINPGDRVAQLVIAPLTIGRFHAAQELDHTARGQGGFGHSGRS